MRARTAKSFKVNSSNEDNGLKDTLVAIPDIVVKLEEVYQVYFNRPHRIHSLDYICDLYEYSKIIGLDFWSTWERIIRYPTVFDHKLQFIEDTIAFILYGKRNMTIENWNRLIDLDDPIVKIDKTNIVKPLPSTFKQINILDTWIKRDNGILDLLVTTNIFIHLINFSQLNQEC